MGKLVYNNRRAVFYKTLKVDVDRYFAENGIAKTGDWRLYLKSLILSFSASAIYAYLLVFSPPPILEIILSAALGLVLSGIGFKI